MYAEFYGLTAQPFQLTPDPRFFFESTVHRRAMAYLVYGLHHAEDHHHHRRSRVGR
jgi:hypothetical protein